MSSKALKKRKASDLGLDKKSSKSVSKRKAGNEVMDDMSLKSIGQEISNDEDVNKMSSKSSRKRKASYADLDPGEGTSEEKQLKLTSKLSDSSSIAGPSKDSSGNSSFEKLRHVFTSSEFSSSEIKSFSLEDSFETPKEMTEFYIPDTVNVLKFAECRAAEIATLMQEVESKRPKLIMQQLPRHMRRRAASHNANRIPRRLREMALKEIQKSKKTKRPSRKHRRRPSNLLFEYNRRQREFVWLETHIWFAKRFKMAELWGYKLPLHPNDKSVRASYRASTKHVLIQDLSYMSCIELKGIANVLLQGLSQLTCTSTGLTFAAKMYLSGSREGRVALYHPNSYPFQCIGPVSFLWKPIHDTVTVDNSEVPNDLIRQLWIWCHPSCYEELVKVFQLIFKLKEDTLKGEKYGLLSDHPKEVQDASDASNGICKTAKNTTFEESSFELKGFIIPKVEKCSESLSSHSEDQKVLSTSNKTLKTKKNAMPIKSAFKLKGFITPKVKKHSETMSSLSEDNVSDISSEILKITKNAASKGSAFELKGHNAPKVETCSKSFYSCSEDKVLDTSEKCKSAKNITFRDHPSKGSKNDLERTEKCDEKVSLRFKKYKFYTGNDITMTLLKDTLVRHRLIGPLAQAVITDTLKLADVGFGQEESISLTQRQKWWETYYGNQKMKSMHQKQKELWQQMHGAQSPGQLPPGVILGLTVKDPRMDLPKVKTKVVNKPEEVWRATPSQWIHSLSSSVSLSPLWEQEIRDEVTITKQTESQLNALRSQFLVPGTPLNLGKDESRIPLIVIQQPGNEGCSGGWDIIAPLGWSMPFWIAFIYRGARASGLRELRSVYHEVGMPLFPFNYPDTFSGQKTAEQNRKDMMAKHLRYPPDKRPSFNKLGVAAPFFVPWEKLVAEWELELVTKSKQFGSSRSAVVITLNNVPNCTVNSDNSELKSVLPNVQLTECSELSSFYVLRDRKLLNLLRETTTVRKQFTPKPMSNMKAGLENLICRVKNDSGLRKALLCIKVKLTTKGNPGEYSALYLPTDGDMKTIKQNPRFGGPTEPSHPAKKIPKEPKKKRKSSVQNQKGSQNVQDSSVECSNSVELLRPEVNTIISTCCRKMIGSVEVGGYSFINACGFGLGHCAFVGFVELLQMCYYAKMPPTVLVRSQSSFQYRFAKIDVV